MELNCGVYLFAVVVACSLWWVMAGAQPSSAATLTPRELVFSFRLVSLLSLYLGQLAKKEDEHHR